MTEEKPESFVSRWSRRKLAAAREPAAPPAVPVPVAAPAQASSAAPELPPVESLTFESDFTAFLQPGVDPATKQAALRKLLRDPRFNAMDGLDVYIDDYTKPSPLDPAIAQRLANALFRPTRVNEQGYAEDVPPEEEVAAQAAPPADEMPRIAQADTAPSSEPVQPVRAPITKDET